MMNTLMAIVQTILTFLGIALIGLVFYSQLLPPYNWIIAALVGVIGIYVSIGVFKMIIRRGYISTSSGSRSSYELDNLKPTPGSGFFEIAPEALKNGFEKGEIVFDKVSISIWGDWKGRKLNQKHKISIMEFDNERESLNIHFSDSCRLEIVSPSLAYYSTSYLKIVKAREVHWFVSKNGEQTNEYHYIKSQNKIKTTSNTDWKPRLEDLGVGMNALYLQG